MPHWREAEACYASLTLRSGEQVTGLVVAADIDRGAKQRVPLLG
jgi:hypothetical protein